MWMWQTIIKVIVISIIFFGIAYFLVGTPFKEIVGVMGALLGFYLLWQSEQDKYQAKSIAGTNPETFAKEIAKELGKSEIQKSQSEINALRSKVEKQNELIEQLIASTKALQAEVQKPKREQLFSVKEVYQAFEQLKTGATEKFRALLGKLGRKKSEQAQKQEAAAHYRQIGALAEAEWKIPEAIAAYRQATELDPENLNGWNELGRLLLDTGEQTEAQQALETVLKLAEVQGNDEYKAIGYGNLGNIYAGRGELEKAKELYCESLRMYEQLGNQDGIAGQYGNLGMIYWNCGQLDEAKELYCESLRIHEQLGDQDGIATIYGNLGLIYADRKKLEKAEKFYTDSLRMYEQLGNPDGMAIQHLNLGVLYKQRGNSPLAAHHWQECLKLYAAMGIPNHLNVQKARHNLARIGGYYDVGSKTATYHENTENTTETIPVQVQDGSTATPWPMTQTPEEK